jgi:hypothetical protein
MAKDKKMKKTAMAIVMLLVAIQASPQTAPNKYWVQFTDKLHTPYSLTRPEDFLSQRAIERRVRYQIPLDEMDLPVDPAYLDSLGKIGVTVLNHSRWFNSATIFAADTFNLDRLRALGFVRALKTVKTIKVAASTSDKFGSEEITGSLEGAQTDTTLLGYGQATRQTGMINGHILHNQGFQGQGMVIAVLDAGFRNADINPAFDSLWIKNHILGSHDFVKNAALTYDGHRHGAQVLSIMAGNLPGKLVGSAPQASYYMLVTEDPGSENLVEEDNWVAGAEFADSAGADLINSSLGYSTFDNPAMSHSYADMDGKTTRVTLAADIACSKGILVVTSAANEGSTAWHYITAPADAENVLTVGAVDSLGNYAYFSSTGPTFDRRVKPNITAQGQYTALVSTDGNVVRGSGTSFSSPLMCGFTACLWQANRSRTPLEIIRAIEQSASQALAPDSLLGYGIPNFGKALFLVQGIDPVRLDQEAIFNAFPNPTRDRLMVDFYSHDRQNITIEVLNEAGQLLYAKKTEVGYTSLSHISIPEFASFQSGVYFLRIISEAGRHQQRIVKLAQ